MELRCDHKLHAILSGGALEFKCSSRFCGAGPGVVVIHRFSPESGELIETKRYRDPVRKEVKKRNGN